MSIIRRIPGFRSGKWWKMLLALIGYGFILLLIFALLSGQSEPTGSSVSPYQTTPLTTQSSFDLDQVVAIGLPIHNHWTEKDINDGKIVYIDLVNKRNEAISFRDADINGLTVTLRVLGLVPGTSNDYSIELFRKTYTDLNYDEITYPQGQNPIIIYYDQIRNYENDCCTAISAEVTLPDGRTIRTHGLYDFDIKPTVVQ